MGSAFLSGILLILAAGCCSGVFSTPFNKNKKWGWENNWLIWSFVALIICPFIAVFCTIPHVFSVYAAHPSTTAIIATFGIIWGISALMFGKGIDYLGVSLAIPIMQGLINAIGTIAPFFKSPGELLQPEYRHILLGVAVTIVGIILFSQAGKSKSQSNPSGKSFTKGLLICLFAGIFGPLINFGFVYGEPLQKTAVELGASRIFSANATWAVIFFTGFLVNAVQCIILLKKNGTAAAYGQSKGINFIWAALAGILWYGSIFLYGMGCNRIGGYAASIGWAIMQATAIIAGNVAGILMGEWKDASRSSIFKMAGGMAFLVVSVLIFSCSGQKDSGKQPIDYVDTRIGSQVWKGPSNLSTPEEPKGFVYPGVGMPNAMIQLTPQTDKTDRPYFSSQTKIQGFRASHYPNGAAMSEYGSFTFMPTTGELKERIHERASHYSNDSEVATPYYYSVNLDDYGIKAELTGVSKSGYLKFTYPASEQSHIIIDNARSEYENYFHIIPERNEIEGFITNAGRVGNQGYTGREFACYFVAKFSKPFASYGIVPEPVFADNTLLVADGFKGEFFNNTDFSGRPVLERTDTDVNFAWEDSPAKGVQADHFAVRYSGKFKARKTGKHIFHLISDDYSRMFVNGEKVIDFKRTHRPAPELYSINLKEGDECDIVVEYVDNTKLATLRFACLEPENRTPEQLAQTAEKGSVGSAVSVTFPTKENEEVEVKVGTSFIDFNQARKNLDSEIGSKNFKQIAQEVKQVWNDEINRIQVETTEENKQIFYTAMQRINCTPRNLTEDGYHYSAFNGKTMPGIMYTDYSIWDTFRALHPLLVILKPEKATEMITALLNCYDEGGWIPKWPSPGYSNIMHGTHGDAIIADAYVKGIRGFDLDKALEAMMKNATTPGTGLYKARVGIQDFIALGYVPTDKWGESVERTMEFAYDDFCIAQVAKGMGREDLYSDLMRRSKNYLNVLDPASKLIRGRNGDGSWRTPFDPAVSIWAEGTDRDCETYYRNISFFAPHDVQGLMDFMGGPAELEKQLDYFFANDFYYVGDEFSMHSPYLYNYAGAPWKTQATIRRLVRENFNNTLGGLPGNEDCGQLSAWYIFSSMGFYPTCPGTLIYQIGSPSFDKVSINLPDGNIFTIVAHNNSTENVYIQSATLNGQPYGKSWIHHDDIMKGGTLIFEMGPEPNREWGL